MLGKIYSMLFILALIAAGIIQHEYLKKSIFELNEQKQNKDAVFPIISSHNFETYEYQGQTLKNKFSGDNLIYYSNKKIIATGNLVYEKLNKIPSKKIVLKSEIAHGDLVTHHTDNNNSYFNNNKLKSIQFPEEVYVFEDKNQGKAQDVLYIAENRLLQSNEWLESWGPLGKLKAKGFSYSLSEDEFSLNSHVDGYWQPKLSSKE